MVEFRREVVNWSLEDWQDFAREKARALHTDISNEALDVEQAEDDSEDVATIRDTDDDSSEQASSNSSD